MLFALYSTHQQNMTPHEKAPQPGIPVESAQKEIRLFPRERLYFQTVYSIATALGPAADSHLKESFRSILTQDSEQLDYEYDSNVDKGCNQAAARWLNRHPNSENALTLQKELLEAPLAAHVSFLFETGAADWINQREETKAAKLAAFQQRRKITIISNLEPLVRDGEVEYTAAREIVMELLPQVAMNKKRRREIAALWSMPISDE